MPEPPDPGSEVVLAWLARLAPVPPRDPRLAAARRAAYMRRVTYLAEVAHAPSAARQQQSSRPPHLAVPLALLLLLAAAFALAGAVASALPGQPLYPLRRQLEVAQVRLRARQDGPLLHLLLAARQLDEMAALARQGRYEPLPTLSLAYERELRLAGEALRQQAATGTPAPATLQPLQGELQRQAALLSALHTALPTAQQPALGRSLAAADASQATFAAAAAVSPPDPTATDGASPKATPGAPPASGPAATALPAHGESDGPGQGKAAAPGQVSRQPTSQNPGQHRGQEQAHDPGSRGSSAGKAAGSAQPEP